MCSSGVVSADGGPRWVEQPGRSASTAPTCTSTTAAHCSRVRSPAAAAHAAAASGRATERDIYDASADTDRWSSAGGNVFFMVDATSGTSAGPNLDVCPTEAGCATPPPPVGNVVHTSRSPDGYAGSWNRLLLDLVQEHQTRHLRDARYLRGRPELLFGLGQRQLGDHGRKQLRVLSRFRYDHRLAALPEGRPVHGEHGGHDAQSHHQAQRTGRQGLDSVDRRRWLHRRLDSHLRGQQLQLRR